MPVAREKVIQDSQQSQNRSRLFGASLHGPNSSRFFPILFQSATWCLYPETPLSDPLQEYLSPATTPALHHRTCLSVFTPAEQKKWLAVIGAVMAKSINSTDRNVIAYAVR